MRTRDELFRAAHIKSRALKEEGIDPYTAFFWCTAEEHALLFDDPNLYRASPVDPMEDRICGMKLRVERVEDSAGESRG